MDPEVILEDEGHAVGAFRDHPLRHSVAHPTANLAGGKREAPGALRGPINQRFVTWSEAAAIDPRQPFPAEPELVHAMRDARAALCVPVEVDDDNPH